MGVKKNPNPDTSGLIKWEKGVSGNPRGNTPEAWVVRRRNAEKAQKIHAVLLESLERWLENVPTDEARTALIRADILNLTKDSLDREYGKAQGSLDLTSSDGSAGPTTIRLVAAKADEDDGTDD